MLSIIAKYPNLINVFAIIVGWLIINIQNNKRETRKETRSELNNIQTLITELTKESIIYHTEKRCTNLEETIVSKASFLSRKIQLAVIPLGSEHSIRINTYKDALMKNNFATSEHSPILEGSDDLLKTIRNEAQQLILELDNSYSEKYHIEDFFKRSLEFSKGGITKSITKVKAAFL